MRDFKGMKRQRGRNRGGGGGKPQHNTNRAFESNGPDNVKVRGNAQTVFEKYQQLARDAGSAGDRVLAENYLQHAEHYFRLLRAMQPQRSPSDIIGRDQLSSGLDIDFEAEPDEQSEGQGSDQDGDDNTGDNQQQGRDRFENRQRDDRQRDDRQQNDRPRDDRQQNDRQQQGEGGNNRSRRDRWRERDDRQGRFERGDQQPRDQQRDPMAVVEPQAQPMPAAEPAKKASPVLRSASGDVSHAPAFLGAPRTEAPAEDAPPKPRRGRKPKTVTADEG